MLTSYRAKAYTRQPVRRQLCWAHLRQDFQAMIDRGRGAGGGAGVTRAGGALGSHFVENVLTVVATCRQQDRPVLPYLTDCCQALYAGTPPPSFVPQGHE